MLVMLERRRLKLDEDVEREEKMLFVVLSNQSGPLRSTKLSGRLSTPKTAHNKVLQGRLLGMEHAQRFYTGKCLHKTLSFQHNNSVIVLYLNLHLSWEVYTGLFGYFTKKHLHWWLLWHGDGYFEAAVYIQKTFNKLDVAESIRLD